jgi:hypothetical protein
MAKRGTFDQDLLALENWPGKKADENYVQSKLRLRHFQAACEAFRQAAGLGHNPNEYWGVSKVQFAEAFADDLVIYESFARLLVEMMQKGWVDEETTAKVLSRNLNWESTIQFIGKIPGLEKYIRQKCGDPASVTSFIALAKLHKAIPGFVPNELFLARCREKLEEQLQKKPTQNGHQVWHNWEALYMIRKMAPNILTDEVAETILPNAIEYMGQAKKNGWEWKSHKARFLRTLPGFRQLSAIHDVMGS